MTKVEGKDRLVRYVRRFFDSEKEAVEAIAREFSCGISKAELFRRVVKRRGDGKKHNSGKLEGDIKSRRIVPRRRSLNRGPRATNQK